MINEFHALFNYQLSNELLEQAIQTAISENRLVLKDNKLSIGVNFYSYRDIPWPDMPKDYKKDNRAMLSDVGGINLSSKNLKLVDDTPTDVDFIMSDSTYQPIPFNGYYPMLIRISSAHLQKENVIK
jgi:hypothetical protein